jgi:hypothetical protein
MSTLVCHLLKNYGKAPETARQLNRSNGKTCRSWIQWDSKPRISVLGMTTNKLTPIYNSVQSAETQQTFQCNISALSSGSKKKPGTTPTWRQCK